MERYTEEDFEDWYDRLCFMWRDEEHDPDKDQAHELWLKGYSPEDADNEMRLDPDDAFFDEY